MYFLPTGKKYTWKTLFSLQGWVCSELHSYVIRNKYCLFRQSFSRLKNCTPPLSDHTLILPPKNIVLYIGPYRYSWMLLLCISRYGVQCAIFENFLFCLPMENCALTILLISFSDHAESRLISKLFIKPPGRIICVFRFKTCY